MTADIPGSACLSPFPFFEGGRGEGWLLGFFLFVFWFQCAAVVECMLAPCDSLLLLNLACSDVIARFAVCSLLVCAACVCVFCLAENNQRKSKERRDGEERREKGRKRGGG